MLHAALRPLRMHCRANRLFSVLTSVPSRKAPEASAFLVVASSGYFQHLLVGVAAPSTHISTCLRLIHAPLKQPSSHRSQHLPVGVAVAVRVAVGEQQPVLAGIPRSNGGLLRAAHCCAGQLACEAGRAGGSGRGGGGGWSQQRGKDGAGERRNSEENEIERERERE